MKKYKILNLYACLGGNRYKWDEVAKEAGVVLEVTAIELDPELARMYKERFPNDIVIVADAHEYLVKNYKLFNAVWSSTPCPSHSRPRYKDELKKLCEFHKIDLSSYKGEQSKIKIARNLVDYEAGRTIFETVLGIEKKSNVKQVSLFD
jgi:site-specific DNA-cytosine methylase